MTAQVANAALVGSAARISRAYGFGARPPVEGASGASAAPSRDEANPYTADNVLKFDPGQRRRRGEFQDHVVSFGGVLVSQDVGATIVQAQAASSMYPTTPAEAERQVASYEYAQSLFGPAEPIVVPAPFPG